jgi:hypothetical protein
MNSRYLCAYHLERLRFCESDAYRLWMEMMRRGAQTYTECRLEAAILYLNTALEISLLRQCCEQNGLFSGVHLLKPAEFLFEALMLEQRYSEADAMLQQISSVTEYCDTEFTVQLRRFLKQAHERVEEAKKHQMLHGVNMENDESMMTYQIH